MAGSTWGWGPGPEWRPARSGAGGRTPLALAVLLAGVLAVLTAVFGPPPGMAGAAPTRVAMAAAPAAECAAGWGTAWMAAPQAAAGDSTLGGATLRLIVRPRLTGSAVRVRLSNVYGDASLVIAAAAVARVGNGAAVVADTVAPITFDGQSRGRIPAGREVLSDPVPIAVEAGRALAVSLHLPSAPRVATVHPVALQTSYLSGRGDFTRAAAAAPFARRISAWPVLTGVEVWQPRPTNAVVGIGDSITDGYGSRADTDQRWTDALSHRLADAGGAATMAVLNAGLSGNQLLVDDPRRAGDSPLRRFERDVAGAAGVTDAVLHVGTNDIAAGRSAEEITAGLRRLAGQARAAGLKVFLTTITPARTGPHGTRAAVATRNAVNAWVRVHGAEHADGVFDFAAAVADRSVPTRLAAAFDSGDGLHLSAAGYRALADAVDLRALTGSPCRAGDPAGTRMLVVGR